MKRRPDVHGVFRVPAGEQGAWACNFGECQEKADFIVLRIWGDEEERMGGCKACCLAWAKADGCKSCMRRIVGEQ